MIKYENMEKYEIFNFVNDRLNDFDNYSFGNSSIIISTLITVRIIN